MNIIETKDLTYSYDGESMAVENISVAVEKGKITAFLGGNGAGKTTLFLNLNGVLTPTSGEVYFNGMLVDYNKKNIKNLRKQVGIVFQDPNDQLFSADVLSDISFGPLNLGLSESEAREKTDKVVDQLGIRHLLGRPTHALSFGQKKRVALAGVLAMDPQVIILDEPTAGLDPAGVSEMLALLSQLQKENQLSIIISTHDIDMVPLCCDYTYIFDHGRVAMHGTSDQIFSHADQLRSLSLRLPRLAHLMEILNKEDDLAVDVSAATISQVRKSIKELIK